MIRKIREAYGRRPGLTAILLLTGAFVFIIAFDLLIVNRGGVWGSTLDWDCQHFAIPEYLRMRFFETKDKYPDFAFQLGGGQNIYNFAYYGIANPLYIPAYFMPGMSMALYIQLLSIAEVLVSSIMIFFLFRKHLSGGIPLVLALMFLFAGPVILHSHRHIMFVNYYPFLLGLFFTVRGRDSVVRLALVSLLTYCIMCTSYYYSVGSFAAVGLYMIFLCLEEEPEIGFKGIVSRIWKKILFAFIGCVCAARIWLPSLAAIVHGRASTSVSVSIKELIVPTLNLGTILYGAYSAGLTSIVVVSVIALVRRGTRSERFLSGVLAVSVLFPGVAYIFNGTMYVDGKAFIPFIPLMLIVCGRFFARYLEGKVNVRPVLWVFIAVMALSFADGGYNRMQTAFAAADTVLIFTAIRICTKKNKRQILLVLTAVISFAVSISLCFMDPLMKKKDLDEMYSSVPREIAEDVLDGDEGIYRFAEGSTSENTVNMVYRTDYLTTNIYSSLSNPYFRDFRFYSSGSEIGTRNNAVHLQPLNIVFNTFMGCRYRLTKNDPDLYGETLVASDGDYRVMKNPNALPIGFACGDVMSKDRFMRLQYELQQEALLTNIIVPRKFDSEGVKPDRTKRLDIDFNDLTDYDGITLKNRLFTINSKKKVKARVELDEPVVDKVLIVTAFADNRIGDIAYQSDVILKINGVSNKLTDPKWKYNNSNYVFSYIISSDEPVTGLDMEFSPGYYNISGFEAYTMEGSVITGAASNKDALIIDSGDPVGDSISGNINVSRDGWFCFTIPYDKGFRIKVDGEEVDYYRTDLAFIGFPISAGEHRVELEYIAPMHKEGAYISLGGVIAAVLLLIVFGITGRGKENVKDLNKTLDIDGKI